MTRPYLLTSLALLLTAGCSRTAAPVAAPVADADGYATTAAAALAYEPPVFLASATYEPDLSRIGRGPASVLGYDSPTVTTYYLRVDDRQRVGGSAGGFGGFGGGGAFIPGHGYLGGGAGGGGGFFDLYARRAVAESTFTRVRP